MIVKVTLSGICDTENQDKYLRQALERLAGQQYPGYPQEQYEKDSQLVAQTFKARFSNANLGVSLLKQ